MDGGGKDTEAVVEKHDQEKSDSRKQSELNARSDLKKQRSQCQYGHVDGARGEKRESYKSASHHGRYYHPRDFGKNWAAQCRMMPPRNNREKRRPRENRMLSTLGKGGGKRNVLRGKELDEDRGDAWTRKAVT